MGYYKLIHETGSGVVKVTGSVSTWFEAADMFLKFLRGSGYELGRQDLSDHYNQESQQPSVPDDIMSYQFAAERETELDNHAARYGMDAEPVPASAPAPTCLYFFTVSDAGKVRTLPEIWNMARAAATEQQALEWNSGGNHWGSYRVVMTGCTVNDSSDGLMYMFEAIPN